MPRMCDVSSAECPRDIRRRHASRVAPGQMEKSCETCCHGDVGVRCRRRIYGIRAVDINFVREFALATTQHIERCIVRDAE